MSGHTSRNGVNCVFHFRSARGELIRKLFYKMLCLRDSHAVSGNDNDFFCAVKACSVVGFGLDFDRFCLRLFGLDFRRGFNGLIHICDKLLQGFLCVAEIQMHAVFAGINGVIYAGVTGF